jgi:hypothetical protein
MWFPWGWWGLVGLHHSLAFPSDHFCFLPFSHPSWFCWVSEKDTSKDDALVCSGEQHMQAEVLWGFLFTAKRWIWERWHHGERVKLHTQAATCSSKGRLCLCMTRQPSLPVDFLPYPPKTLATSLRSPEPLLFSASHDGMWTSVTCIL